MEFGAAEVVGLDDLAEGRLHDRRSAEEDPADALDHDHLVAQRRDVGATGGAAAEHDRQLGEPLGREAGLAVEAAAEVVLVGEDLVLQRKERAARVDEIDHAEAVLLGDLLGSHVLLDRDRHERAALDGGVVGDEHPRHPVHDADPGDDAAAGHLVAVLAEAGQGRELEEGGVVVGDHVDAVPHHHLAARQVAFDRPLPTPATVDGDLLAFAKRRHQLLVGGDVLGVLRRSGVDPRVDLPHRMTPSENWRVMISASSSRFPRSGSNHSTAVFMAPKSARRLSPTGVASSRSPSSSVQRAS